MNTTFAEGHRSQMAACVAPEDLNRGDYVSTLNVVCEFPSFYWGCDGSLVLPHEPVKVQFRAPDAGVPLKVEAICLPFVFVKCPEGKNQTLDIRRTQLVRLSKAYAKTVWKKTHQKV